MAKKEQEMYEGMPVIEASDGKSLEKKLSGMAERPDKYVVRISNKGFLWMHRSNKYCHTQLSDRNTKFSIYRLYELEERRCPSICN